LELFDWTIPGSDEPDLDPSGEEMLNRTMPKMPEISDGRGDHDETTPS
jgi:hypothetical protein